MTNITTLTQKGQITIPKEIREHFDLATSDKLIFEIDGDRATFRPVRTPKQAQGLFKTSIKATRAEERQAVKDAVVDKYKKKMEWL